MTRSHARVTVFVLALLLINALAVIGQDVKITVNPKQDFSKFTRYSWKENQIAPGQLPAQRKVIENQIKEIVNTELSAKGYQEDPANPDFLLEVRAAALPGEVQTSANPDLRVPSNVTVYDSQVPAGAGVSAWLAITAGARIIVTGKVSGATAWEAIVTKKYKNPDKFKQGDRLQREIENFFKKGLKDFPPRKKV